MIRRHELSDGEWEVVQPLLPTPVLGRPRLDDRTVLNGIVWQVRTGVAGGTCPSDTGREPASTPVSAGGPQTGRARDAPGRAGASRRGRDIDWLVPVDSSIVRARQHGAGARKGALEPGTRTVPRRAGQQNPPGLRRLRPPVTSTFQRTGRRGRSRRGGRRPTTSDRRSCPRSPGARTRTCS
ncbi:transposase [Streptomyces sp. NPDC048603]|uniref:transposase n=1 Tax=Streptomyces sp. NPDC048603 TaxID=3365577 RepID=UPI00371F3E19